MVRLVGLVQLHSFNLAVDIGSQVLFFELFPSVAVRLDATKSI